MNVWVWYVWGGECTCEWGEGCVCVGVCGCEWGVSVRCKNMCVWGCMWGEGLELHTHVAITLELVPGQS